jgi:hypothetical protein
MALFNFYDVMDIKTGLDPSFLGGPVLSMVYIKEKNLY